MKQADKKGKNNEIGAIGETVAAKYLERLGLVVIDQNYLKKWGEIDIVARATDKIHFIEVKTVSYETKQQLKVAVSHGTWRPEENVHQKKLLRMSRAIESWILENNIDLEWQIDVLAIRIVPRERYATVKYLPNIIID
jgi:putative endonuclease